MRKKKRYIEQFLPHFQSLANDYLGRPHTFECQSISSTSLSLNFLQVVAHNRCFQCEKNYKPIGRTRTIKTEKKDTTNEILTKKNHLSINRQLVFTLCWRLWRHTLFRCISDKRNKTKYPICGLCSVYWIRIDLITVITRSLNKQSMQRHQLIANVKTVARYNRRNHNNADASHVHCNKRSQPQFNKYSTQLNQVLNNWLRNFFFDNWCDFFSWWLFSAAKG